MAPPIAQPTQPGGEQGHSHLSGPGMSGARAVTGGDKAALQMLLEDGHKENIMKRTAQCARIIQLMYYFFYYFIIFH
jgi:hypothetical protein